MQRVAGCGDEFGLGAVGADELDLAPAALSSRATARAGTTWPAVPPAAITIFVCVHGSIVAVVRPTPRVPDRAHVARRSAGDVEQQPHRDRA